MMLQQVSRSNNYVRLSIGPGGISSVRLAPGFHCVRDIVVEGGTIRFKADDDNG
jgi:hypothetical protein